MTDKNFSLLDLRAVSKPVCKLIDVVSGAIGLLYERRRITQAAHGQAEATVILAEADARAEEITFRSQERLRNREHRRQSNLESIVALAVEELPETVSEEPVNEDWIHHFVGNCADVGDKQMQELWARILAGEVESPGRFSKRFLEFMKCLGKHEALAIGEFYRYIWFVGTGEQRSAVYLNDSLIQMNAPSRRSEPFVPYSLRMEMVHLGLIHEDISLRVDRRGRVEFSYQDMCYFSEDNNFLPPEISVDCLTTLGQELLHICKPTVAQEYLDASVNQYHLVSYKKAPSQQTDGTLQTT